MWFKLNTTFTQSLGTLSSLSNSWSITRNLTNFSTTSTVTSVAKDGSYSATFTLNSGCTYSSHSVTMGGATVTSGVSYSNGTLTVSISKVTGAVVITAVATGASSGGGTGGGGTGGTGLDAICYEGMTYRQIFIENNIGPRINQNSWDSTLGTYVPPSGMTLEVATAESNCVPTYSIRVTGTKSIQSKVAGDSKKHLVAANIKVVNYTAGNIGVFTDDETSLCTLNQVTSGYQTVVAQSTKNSRGYYVGSVNSANLTGYINNPVIVPTDIFSTVPSVAQFTEWYNTFNNYLINNPDIVPEQPEVITPTNLDSIIYESLTVRDIFINNNYAPDVNNNSYVSKKTGGTFIPYDDGSVPIVKETSTTNCAPTYSLKVEGTTSQQIYESTEDVPAGKYYFAYNINVTERTKGYFGMMFDGSNGSGHSYDVTALNRTTSGFETVVSVFTSSTTDQLYLGSISSASGKALINNPVLVSSSIFTTPPTSQQFRTMFEYYNDLLS